MTDSSSLTLGAIFYPGFELLDTFGPLEMFGNVGPGLRIATIAEQAGEVRSAQGPRVLAKHGFADAPECELLLLPGGVGTFQQLENADLLGFLKERSRGARAVMSVCSGSALLARAGLLDGQRATSNKQFFDLARAQSGAVDWVEEARWVEDGPWFTSSGVSAGMDMALAVIERLFGNDRALEIADLTEYEWHRDPDRDPFVRCLNQGDAAAFAPPDTSAC